MKKPNKPPAARGRGGKALPRTPFPSAGEDAGAAERLPATPQTRSGSHRLAYADGDFLLRDELRSLRLQLEFEKADLIQRDHGVESTVVVFGSTRVPEPRAAAAALEQAEKAAAAAPADAPLAREAAIARRILEKCRYYEEARELARLITATAQADAEETTLVVTGGGPGIMEAANRGAADAGGKSIGLNIVLPREQRPNAYVTPELSFQFNYFALRKMHFLLRARAVVMFPGGFGTLDEFFETLTLMQTGKIKPLPVLLFGKTYWRRIIDFEALVEEGTIDPGDLKLFRFVETAAEAWEIIQATASADPP